MAIRDEKRRAGAALMERRPYVHDGRRPWRRRISIGYPWRERASRATATRGRALREERTRRRPDTIGIDARTNVTRSRIAEVTR